MIGGDIRGLGVARVLAEKGVEVILVEPGKELVTDIGTRSRRFQVELVSMHTRQVFGMPGDIIFRAR